MEEIGIDFKEEDIKVICVFDELNFIESHSRHGVGIGLEVKYSGQEIKLMEPEKCIEWKWFDLNNLPTPMFSSSKKVIDCFLNNKIY